jgi:Cytotoxic
VAVQRPTPGFLDQMEPLGAIHGRKRWRSPDGKRIYEWDSLHGEVEGYNQRGKHVGVFHAVTGELIKPAVRERTIDV